MRSSSAIRRASARASSAHSASVTPAIGISGSTSVAPMRGCAPLWRRMSISSAARFTPAKAASTTASGSPTKVTTVRLVASPGSTSSSLTPPEASMAAVICRITALSRPSLKLGTHSMILWDIGSSHLNSYTSKINNNREKSEKTVTKQAAFCEKQKGPVHLCTGPGLQPDRNPGAEAPRSRKREVICRWSASPRPYTRNPAGGFRRCRSSACR